MRSGWRKISVVCGVIGLCCLIAAGLFTLYNMYDDTRAANELNAETEKLEAIVLSPERAREVALNRILRETPAPIVPQETPAQGEPTPEPTPTATPVPENMPVLTIDGEDFVAIIGIPALDLEFPVRNEWSKKGAKNSPCRYVGSVYTNDLIICAHNYSSHFGRLKELKQGDEIILVDMNGEIYTYHVELTEEIHRYNVEDMICSGYDLTLFTCTLDAVSRVTVRCTRDA